MTAYLHPDYAGSLAEFGRARELPRSGGWILQRPIQGVPLHDGMGCYPLFACREWSNLGADLEEIGRDLVSVCLVTDPFGSYDESDLRQWFPDVCFAFKTHYVTDLTIPLETTVGQHHRYYAKRAFSAVSVEVCTDPASRLEEWVDLYGELIRRHALRGIKSFSRQAFAKQLALPGTVMLRALCDGTVAGAHVWYLSGEVGYSHLAAFSENGYRVGASYALYWSALEHFAGKVRWLDLGAGAGAQADAADGLSRFKRGWATGSRPVYFCGRIFDRRQYESIVRAKGIAATNYFPAYRQGEFF